VMNPGADRARCRSGASTCKEASAIEARSQPELIEKK
jgi:hypothetical protein